jgi:uncharacterized membrane protein YfcA
MTARTTDGASPASSRTTTILIVLVGVGAGFLSGLFGVGGGLLVVPGLLLVAKMDQRLAHGTSLAAVLPISAASMITYWTLDNIDWSVALFLAVGAVAGAVLGTRLLSVLPYRTLGIAFSIVLILSAIRLFIPTDGDGRADLTVVTALGLMAIGVLTGVLAGLLGVGGGIVMVPAMIVLFGITPVIAKGTSLVVIIPTAVMGTWRNRAKNNADLRSAAVLGLGGVPFAFAGAWVSDRMSDELSNILFAALLVIVAVRLLVQLEREPETGPNTDGASKG